jgi:membrane associated rhomboid family serine protease
METGFSYTIVIVIITVITSLIAMNNGDLMGKLIFDPVRINGNRQYYRFLSSGFIHGDYFHLGFNMIALYSFGSSLEKYILSDHCVLGSKGPIIYLLIYLTGIIFANLPSYAKHRDNQYFLSLGASGGVSALIFVCIALVPQLGIEFIFLPGVPIPGYIFGILYIIVSAYLDQRGGGRINHSAHLWGALYGLVAIFLCIQLMSNLDFFENFKTQVKLSPKTFYPFCALQR